MHGFYILRCFNETFQKTYFSILYCAWLFIVHAYSMYCLQSLSQSMFPKHHKNLSVYNLCSNCNVKTPSFSYYFLLCLICIILFCLMFMGMIISMHLILLFVYLHALYVSCAFSCLCMYFSDIYVHVFWVLHVAK